MSQPLGPMVAIDAHELDALRLAAERYRWLRERAVRIQGSEVWYAGSALDYRVDVGRHHLAIEGEQVGEPVAFQRQSRRLPKTAPQLK
ncbi:hypothetical protein D3C81_1889870 [compost metagenome]